MRDRYTETKDNKRDALRAVDREIGVAARNILEQEKHQIREMKLREG